MSNKYHVKTFGCAMNYSDSERIAAVLKQRGLTLADSEDNADIVVFNTCGVRQMAEDRVYGQIHNLRQETSTKKQETKIIVTGCLAERKDVKRRLKDKVDLFTSIEDFPKKVSSILYLVSGKDNGNENYTQNTKYDIQDTENLCNPDNYLQISPAHNSLFSAHVPIMTGCNNFCSYCVVPYARGREKSRPAEEVLDEVRDLVEKGYKKITLLGQNVNSYKARVHKVKKFIKSDEVVDFSTLLKKINSIPGKFWISFVSSHPKDMTDQLIDTITSLPKVCEHVHLPIQAGNDDILKSMNRKYTRDHYLKLINKIKKGFVAHKPGVPFAVTSDIIVGFPGETDEQFLDSADVMKEVGFDMAYFSRYSPRPGTAAAKLADDVLKAEKARREKYLNDILKKSSFANGQALIGKTLDVLIDRVKSDTSGRAAEKEKIYFGKTRTAKNVKIARHPERRLEPDGSGRSEGSRNLVGNIVKVEITKANNWNVEGIISF